MFVGTEYKLCYKKDTKSSQLVWKWSMVVFAIVDLQQERKIFFSDLFNGENVSPSPLKLLITKDSYLVHIALVNNVTRKEVRRDISFWLGTYL